MNTGEKRKRRTGAPKREPETFRGDLQAEAAARRLKALKNRQEALQQEIDQLEDDLKARLEALQVDEMQAGPFRVKWKPVTSSRFDPERFEAENRKLYAQYVFPNSYRKFSVV